MKKNAEELKFPLKGKYVAMLAPSFVVDFSYPKILSQLKSLGFDKIVFKIFLYLSISLQSRPNP